MESAHAKSDNRIVTFGCRVNAYESEVIREHLEATGRTGAVVVNTCAVTAEAERQARQTIRRLRRDHPQAEIIVTGCSAQIDPLSYAHMPEVDRVLGNAEKMQARSYHSRANDPIAVSDIMEVRETAGHLISGFESRARAFVEVQQGCDHRCTFCIIPFGRGNNRSVPLGRLTDQVRMLVAQGYKEVVLTGVDICSYGRDLPGRPTLGQAARRLLGQVPDLKRLRLSSLDPAAMDEDLFRLLSDEPRLMPHLHLSVQAGDDVILKRMKRRHVRGDVIKAVERARKARTDVVFGADLIAGFPTETDTMFENTLGLVDEAELTYLHVFPYSERPGTPAARMPQVDPAVRKERAARLRESDRRNRRRFFSSQVGKRISVLTEKDESGHSEHFAPVRIEDTGHSLLGPTGAIQPVAVSGATQDYLIGRLA